MVDPITIAGATVGGLVGAGLLNGPMQTLQDVWQICFNRWTDNWLEKQKIIQEQNLVEFKERIEYKAQQIPPEHIQEPDISIIGPALEASRFYIGEPDIRELFANLIAASMSQAHNEQVHHAFVELIKMLSPKDARLLNYLHISGDESIARIIHRFPNSTLNIIVNHLLIWEEEVEVEANIDNLIRLGVAAVSYDSYRTDTNLYDKFYTCQQYLNLQEELKAQKENLNIMLASIDEITGLAHADGSFTVMDDKLREDTRKRIEDNLQADVEIIKGRISLTAFGKNFCKVCC